MRRRMEGSFRGLSLCDGVGHAVGRRPNHGSDVVTDPQHQIRNGCWALNNTISVCFELV